jgi:GT2 family glycosyltransferase
VLQSLPDSGVVGAQLKNGDRTLQTSCVQAFPSIWNNLLDTELLRRRFPGASLWGSGALFERRSGPISVAAISGACLMIKRNVFKAVKGFSTAYFMYTEDVDLCYKVMKAGWKRYYCSDAVVVHYGARSASVHGETYFSAVMMRESRWTFFNLRRDKQQAVLYRLTVALSAILRLVVLAVALLATLGSVQGAALRRSLGKWYHILRWSVGAEEWVKRIG